MTVTLAPTFTVSRVAALLGLPRHTVEQTLNNMYAAGLDVEKWPFERGIAAVRAFLAGHSPDAVELLLHWPYLNSDGWLVSSEDDAHLYPSLLQAMAAIDSHPYISYRLTPVAALRIDAA